jgi:hypothetical protein
MGEWRYRSTILDLDIRWRRVVSFTPLPLYPKGTSSRYPLDRRLLGPQSRAGCCGKNCLASAGSLTSAVLNIGYSFVAKQTRNSPLALSTLYLKTMNVYKHYYCFWHCHRLISSQTHWRPSDADSPF